MTALRVLLVAMVFYLPNQAQFPFEFTIRGLNTINVLFILIFFTMLKNGVSSREPTPLKGTFVFFFLLLLWATIVGIVSDASIWVEDVTTLKNNIFYMSLYFLFFHAVQDMKTLRVLVFTILFVTFTSAFLGLRQALDYGIGVFNETRRVSAPFGWGFYGANRSAIFFCLFLPLVASAALFLKSRPMLRLACLGTALLGVFVVFHTFSRQAYFILVVLALLLTLRKNLFVTVLISLALLNYDAWVPEAVIERIESTSSEQEKPSASGEEKKFDDSTESRFLFWAGAWELIQERPWGIGLNHFKREIGDYVPPHLAGKDAHNFYVLITTEAGMLAPLVVLLLLFGMIRLGSRVAKLSDDEETRMLGVGYSVGVVAMLLGNIYGSRFLDGDVAGNFWILTALVARYEILKRRELSREEATHDAAEAAVDAVPAVASPPPGRFQ